MRRAIGYARLQLAFVLAASVAMTLCGCDSSLVDPEADSKHVTKNQNQGYIEQTAAFDPMILAIGETATIDTATLTVDSFSYVDDILPSDTSGFYSYYEHQDGKSYLLACATFTNDGTEYAVPGYSTQAWFDIAGNKYLGQIEVDAGSHLGKSYSVEAKDTETLYIYCLVPDSVKGLGKAKLTWSIPADQALMNRYYNEALPHYDFIITE